MRKPAFCIFENKGADQLCGDRTADQRLCFHYIGNLIVQFLCFLHLQASSYLLVIYSRVCVGHGRKHKRQVLS